MNRVKLIGIAVLVALTALAWAVWHVPGFQSIPNPAQTYAEAVGRFQAIEAAESRLPLCPEGRSRLLVHGHKTDRVFVLLHGLTNCPEQFVPLAKILHASGANVILPRARLAGFANRLNAEQGLQSGQDLLDQAATGIDLAAGLGDHISIVGLSGSAVAAAWMAQHRPGIDHTVLLSPFFSLHGHSPALIDTAAGVLMLIPNFYNWWDAEKKASLPGPVYAYPRYGSHCMAETVELSRCVRAGLTSRPILSKHLDIWITATDLGAHNELTKSLAAQWEKQRPGSVTLHEFSLAEGIPHDMIDIHQPGANPNLVYPLILSRLQVGLPAAASLP